MMLAKSMLPQSSMDWILHGMDESYTDSGITIERLPLITVDEEDSICRSSMASTSFSWSDFPCYGDDDHYDLVVTFPVSSSSPSLSPSIPPCTRSTEQEKQGNNGSSTTWMVEDDATSSSPSPSHEAHNDDSITPRMSSPPSPTSCCCDLLSMPDTISSIPQSLSFSSSTSTNIKKRVSFAPMEQVRTHTIVLGDHPLCTGGMALQLGWEHTPIENIPMMLSCSSQISPQRRSVKQLRLNYHQRRQRLMDVTGLTCAQLLHQEYLLVCCNDNNDTATDDFTTTATKSSDI